MDRARTSPGSPWNSKARTAPPGGRKRNAVETVLPEPVDSRIDRELGLVGADGIFQEHVEQLLVPVEIEIVRKRRSGDVGAGGIV